MMNGETRSLRLSLRSEPGARVPDKRPAREVSERVALDCGLAASIRPARASDLPELEALHQRLSPETIWQRYFSHRRPARELVRAIAMDARQGVAYLASVGTLVPSAVAFGYYVVTEPPPYGRAELALVVEDRLQGCGLGKALLRSLVDTAREEGIALLDVETAADNAAALQLFRGAGIAHRAVTRRGITEIRMDLTLEDPRWQGA